jgi:hypothetical protein
LETTAQVQSPARATANPALTLSDLGVFTFGAAVALMLPWSAVATANPSQGWYNPATDVLSRVALALLPVAFARRARLGGAVRPAELLLAACAAPAYTHHVLYWLDIFEPSATFGDDPLLPHARFYAAIWSLTALAVLGLTLGRRRIRGPARGALWIVAVLASYPWLDRPLMSAVYLYDNSHGPDHPAVADVLILGADLLTQLGPAVIGAIAVRDALRNRSQTGKLAWLVLGLAASLLTSWLVVRTMGLVWVIRVRLAGWAPRPTRDELELAILMLAVPILSGLIGWYVAVAIERRYGLRQEEPA